MALSFDATYYLNARPDVFHAFVATAGATGKTWAQFAEEHYNTYGRFEGANPNATFNTDEYLAANPDVAAAGVNPFTHYLHFGAAEGRAPSNSFPSFASFDSAAYLAANPDLGAAGIDTPNEAYAHFVIFGQFEDRPGAPQIDHGLPGVTSTLTTGIDNFSVAGGQATNGNDLFLAVANGGTVLDGTTFNNGDTINGGAGKDVLRVVASANTTTTPNLTSVETIDGQVFGAATQLRVNLATSTGVEKLSLSNGNGTMIGQNVANLVDLELNNTNGGTLRANYNADTIAGLADVQNVSLNNTTNSTVTVAGVETVNIEARGANTGATLNAGAATTINVSGSGSLALNAVGAAVTTFDASANTGGVRTTFTAGGDVAATGGSGNDTFNFGTGLTTADVVNGGEGFDTVRVSNAIAVDISAATAAAAFNGLTSIERVAFDGAGVTLNGATFTNAGVTNIEMNTGGNDTINNAASARTYEFGTANAGSATFNMNGTSTELNLAMLGTQGTAAPNDGTSANVNNIFVNLSGVAPAGSTATININSMGDLADGAAGVYNNVGVITAVAGSTIKITGEGNLDIAGLANRGTIDASSATGNLILEGSQATLATVVNSALSGADIVTLGAGRDTVQFDNGLDSGVLNNTPGAVADAMFVDVINNFTAGANGDVLDWTGAVGTVQYTAMTAAIQAQIDALSGAGATLLAAANLAVDLAETAAGAGWTAFSFQGQTYALYDADGGAGAGETYNANNDLLVQLTGVAVADLTAANFA